VAGVKSVTYGELVNSCAEERVKKQRKKGRERERREKRGEDISFSLAQERRSEQKEIFVRATKNKETRKQGKKER